MKIISSRVELILWENYINLLVMEVLQKLLRVCKVSLKARLSGRDEGSADLLALPGKVSNLTIFFGT